MSQEIEIEFKNMLTKSEFERLLVHFAIQATDFHVQHNHYFDTPEQALKQHRAGLRIRQLPNRNELTLKEAAKGIALLETTDSLTNEQVLQVLENNTLIPAIEVKLRLDDLQIPLNKLQKIGTLSTTRAEINYNGGLLVFDHSQYANTDDYELEYEVTDEQSGKLIFMDLLKTVNIPLRPAQKKLVRFMQAIQN